jgi:hypothetical protein
MAITIVLLEHVFVLAVVANVVDNVLFGYGTSRHQRNAYVTPGNDIV